MPRYVVERNIPGAGNFSEKELQALSKKSNGALLRIRSPLIHWLHSYVAQNKTYCVYIAPNEELLRDHARLAGFPVSGIYEVKNVIDPVTAESHSDDATDPVPAENYVQPRSRGNASLTLKM